jgi:hypothetical protein
VVSVGGGVVVVGVVSVGGGVVVVGVVSVGGVTTGGGSSSMIVPVADES